jgi:hypothetical protein
LLFVTVVAGCGDNVDNPITIGGTVTGLDGTGLVLRNNGGNDLAVAADGTFVFSSTVLTEADYEVTVATQPSGPTQVCTVTNGSGVAPLFNVTNIEVACETRSFKIGGTVSRLAGSGLVLQNNGGDNLSVAADGSFEFSTTVASGGDYDVSVLTQPTSASQDCVVTGGSGTVSDADVTNVDVTCNTKKFKIGLTVAGLVGSGLVLRNNGGDNLPVPVNGTYQFTTAIDSGASFNVTAFTQPSSPTQTCVVTGGTGVVGNGDVSSVMVNCTTNHYTISGTISGLDGTVVLQNNGTNDLPVTSNGTFSFTTTVASGATYDVTVLTNPTSPKKQTCVVTSGGSGTVANANVTDVVVTCTTDTFLIKGTLTGLASGNTLVLQNNAADDLSLTANGGFEFATRVASGSPYAVTVLAGNPTGAIVQTCAVTDGSGVVGAADVTNVVVTCTTTHFTVRAAVTGLTSGTLVLQNNAAGDLSITNDGTYAFAPTVPSGGAYAVTVKTQPGADLTCGVQAGTGTVGAADVTVNVTCRPPCFDFTNDASENLTNNNWFDACVSTPGNTLHVKLRDTNGTVLYQASGAKVGTWTPFDFLTSTNTATYGSPPNHYNDQFYSPVHDRMIVLDNGDRLMIPGRGARNGGCGGSLGDGYGIVIYPSSPNYYNNVKLMIQPYRQMGYQVGTPRYFPNWTPTSEITWNGGTLMNTCNATTAFAGRFSVTVTP